jgi:hypothetical protein
MSWRKEAQAITIFGKLAQECDQVDAAVVPDYNLGNFLRTLATPEPIKTGR